MGNILDIVEKIIGLNHLRKIRSYTLKIFILLRMQFY